MIKLIIKLAIAAFIVNACWRIGSAYTSYYRFKDAVEDATQFGGGRSEAELQQRIIDLASEYDIPLAPDAFSIRREGDETYTHGEYTEEIDFAPGFTRPWTFTWDTKTYVAMAPKPER